jgi:hypothetical protein
MGYWAELFVSEADRKNEVLRRAEAALAAALQAVEHGTNSGGLYKKVIETLGNYTLHPVLGGNVGRSIGLSLNEGSEACRHSDNLLWVVNDDVYALHTGAYDPQAGGAIVSAIITMTPKGCEVLVRSRDM